MQDVTGETVGGKSYWNNTSANIIKFSGTSATYKSPNISFDNFSAAGIIVEENSPGYSLSTAFSQSYVATFRATSDEDAASDTRLTAGAVNFIIASDFSLGTSTSNSTNYNTMQEIVFDADANVALSFDAVFSMESESLTTGSNAVSVSGDGTYALNITTTDGMDLAGSWKVGTGSTLQLNSNAAAILTTNTGTGSVTLDGGTISLEAGSIVLQDIYVTGNGGGLAIYTTDSEGNSTLTLNGSITAAELSDISLDLLGVDLILGTNFSIDLTSELTASEVSVFQNLSSFTNENLYFINVTVNGTAVDKVYYSYDENGVLSIVPEPTSTSLSLVALAGLLVRRRRKA